MLYDRNPPSLPAVYELRVEGWASDDNMPLLAYKDDHQELSWKLFFAGRQVTLQYFHSCLICLMTHNTQLRRGLVLKVH